MWVARRIAAGSTHRTVRCRAMSELLWIQAAVLGLVAVAAAFVRLTVRDLWDAMLAVAFFIALYSGAGDVLAAYAEAAIARIGLIHAEAGTLTLAGHLVAIVGASLAACIAAALVREFGRGTRGREPA